MKTYLSIDIDFWEEVSPTVVKEDLRRIFSELKRRRIPTLAVMNHQQLLPAISESGARQLVNVDQHSDLASKDVEKLECGSWVSYVSWRRKGKYVWIHRNSLWCGECNGSDPIFDERRINKRRSDWGALERRNVKKLPPIKELLKGVVAAGICLSPSYIDSTLERAFRQTVRKYKIPYKRGRRNEHGLEVAKKPS